jgi:hypothetical protein
MAIEKEEHMTWYTLQVSNHPGAGYRIPTQAASESWEVRYDGPIATPAEARKAVDDLAKFYRNVIAFRGREIGKLWYAHLSTR